MQKNEIHLAQKQTNNIINNNNNIFLFSSLP